MSRIDIRWPSSAVPVATLPTCGTSMRCTIRSSTCSGIMLLPAPSLHGQNLLCSMRYPNLPNVPCMVCLTKQATGKSDLVSLLASSVSLSPASVQKSDALCRCCVWATLACRRQGSTTPQRHCWGLWPGRRPTRQTTRCAPPSAAPPGSASAAAAHQRTSPLLHACASLPGRLPLARSLPLAISVSLRVHSASCLADD